MRNRKKTMAFVDYEYWFYSCKTRHHTKPELTAWRDELKERYYIDEIMVFGDFTEPEIKTELTRLREITSTIIETGNTYQNRKKDMTDFVMLDYIYQCAATRRDIKRYIIFTGDGHFQSVVRYLVQKKGCEVIVYGIRDTFSRQLRDSATLTVELPCDDPLVSYYRMIVRNIAYVKTDPSKIPSFNGTVTAVAMANGVPKDRVRTALINMMNKGYIIQRDYIVEPGKKIKILDADWEFLASNGLLAGLMSQ